MKFGIYITNGIPEDDKLFAIVDQSKINKYLEMANRLGARDSYEWATVARWSWVESEWRTLDDKYFDFPAGSLF